MAGRIKNAREKVSNGLAMSAWFFALIGGLAATSMWIGQRIVDVIQIGPWWIPFVLGVLGFWRVLKDLAEDGIPDKLLTIYITIMWPSTWLAIDGKAGKYLNTWLVDLNNLLDKYAKEWFTDNNTAKGAFMTGIALIFVTSALFMAHSYAKKNRGTTTSTSTSTSTAPAVSTRGRGRGTR